MEPEGDSVTVGGITVQELPAVYQQLHELPQGLYVVDSAHAEVIPGDVLISFDHSVVGSLAVLNALQDTCQAGQQVELMFYRQNADYFTYTVALEAD